MLASAVIAVMMGLGIGGGGLLVIYLTLVCGTEQLSAQGINLIFFVCTAAASLFIHFTKRKIMINQVILSALFGVIGSLFGTWISHSISSSLLRKLFGALLIICGIMSLIKKHKQN